VPIRALVDANIFISYLLSPDSGGAITGTVESLWRNDIELVFPDSVATEIRATVQRKSYLRNRIAPEDFEALISELRAIALPADPSPLEILPVLRDSKDDYLLAEAVRANVDYLVSGDRDLLDIRDDIVRPRIVRPVEFLTAISHP
jgi:putative PIN family toxin of toxin-antitoxin system